MAPSFSPGRQLARPCRRASRPRGHRASAALLALGVLLVSAGPSSAARPVEGGRYVTSEMEGFDPTALVELQVSSSGRAFRPAGSSIEVQDWFCGGVAFQVGRRGHPVRIEGDGRFRLRGEGRRAIRLLGRFVTPDKVKIGLDFRSVGKHLPHFCGKIAHTKVRLERVRRYPFRSCRDHPENSTVDTPSGRVFHVWRYTDKGWEQLVFACLFSENRQVVLDRRRYVTDDAEFVDFKMAGPYVAYSQFECFGLACPHWWTLVDLRDGKRLHEFPRDLVGAQFDATPDLELNENGSVGVMGCCSGAGNQREVWAYDSGGPRQLDIGNIDAGSLELVGSTLSWVKDGTRHSAVLD
jgi:hypothetical protein